VEMFYHIVDRAAWEQARAAGSYRPPSLDAEGFIHGSYAAQVVMPANNFYRGQANLVLLRIDPARVQAAIRHEPVGVSHDGVERIEVFPHIYGPLNPDAVVAVLDFPPGPDGRFALPPELAQA
jgi:uncharacterized protein (DUF952 family)